MNKVETKRRIAVGAVGWCCLFAVFAALGGQARANIIFAVTYDPTISSDPNAAAIEATINQAINFYEANITTPITVSLTFAEMTSGLGQSSTYYGTITYSQYRAALASHSSGDAVDTAALASLPGGSNNPVNGTTSVDVTTANLRALGFLANPPGGQSDSTISVNTSITNYGGSFNSSNYSLLAVLEHEIDEALGLGSDLDTGSTTGAVRPEDLFRYSGTGVRSYSLSSGATSYLSVNGGVTNIIGFNQSGGGADYGDWANSATPHVQDAFGTPGASPVFGVPEQTALDAIGYTFDASVPEPGSISLALLGLACLCVRRRNLI
jgi:hypothetical protein